MLTSLYSATEKHSCIKLDLTEVGHIPRGASDITGSTSKKLKGLERKRLGDRIVFAGEPGFTRFERVGEHAEHLVSMPWEV